MPDPEESPEGWVVRRTYLDPPRVAYLYHVSRKLNPSGGGYFPSPKPSKYKVAKFRSYRAAAEVALTFGHKATHGVNDVVPYSEYIAWVILNS